MVKVSKNNILLLQDNIVRYVLHPVKFFVLNLCIKSGILNKKKNWISAVKS